MAANTTTAHVSYSISPAAREAIIAAGGTIQERRPAWGPVQHDAELPAGTTGEGRTSWGTWTSYVLPTGARLSHDAHGPVRAMYLRDGLSLR